MTRRALLMRLKKETGADTARKDLVCGPKHFRKNDRRGFYERLLVGEFPTGRCFLMLVRCDPYKPPTDPRELVLLGDIDSEAVVLIKGFRFVRRGTDFYADPERIPLGNIPPEVGEMRAIVFFEMGDQWAGMLWDRPIIPIGEDLEMFWHGPVIAR